MKYLAAFFIAISIAFTMVAGIPARSEDSVTASRTVELDTITLINGDVNGDNSITNADLDILLANLDQKESPGDLDGDGEVTSSDLSIVIKNLNTAEACSLTLLVPLDMLPICPSFLKDIVFVHEYLF